MGGIKWTRRSTRKLAWQLDRQGLRVCANTVARLLKMLGYSLRANLKKLSGGHSPERDGQFRHIAELRRRFAQKGWPAVSIDTKKKELVGNFKNAGRAWSRQPCQVQSHDFRSQADGIAVPYGIYDLQANQGTVFVGMSADTPQFAVDCIQDWWRRIGLQRYPQASQLLILADSGGSNSPTARAFKHGIQSKLCDAHGLRVTLAHYPSGASKWNPIEHRLFSEITKNWQGRPLQSFQTILNYIRTTTTRNGLAVKAFLVRKKYSKGIKISDQQMRTLRIEKHPQWPKQHYVLSPNFST